MAGHGHRGGVLIEPGRLAPRAQRGGVELDTPGPGDTLAEVVAISERFADLPLETHRGARLLLASDVLRLALLLFPAISLALVRGYFG